MLQLSYLCLHFVKNTRTFACIRIQRLPYPMGALKGFADIPVGPFGQYNNYGNTFNFYYEFKSKGNRTPVALPISEVVMLPFTGNWNFFINVKHKCMLE